MFVRAIRVIIVFVLLFLVVGCEKVEPVVPTSAPNDTAAPSPMPSPTPTATSEPEGSILTVPRGQAPIIDGAMLEGEWRAAVEIPLPDGSKLFFLHAVGYLYLGIQANTDDMIVGNIFIDQGDDIAILHTSAALGTAIYTKENSSWQQTKDFEWCCRERVNSAGAQAARQTFLEKEGWAATNTRIGTPNELEYQIAMPGETLRLAVTFFHALDSAGARIFWPEGLDDDCLFSPQGRYPVELHFSPEKWAMVLSEEKDEN